MDGAAAAALAGLAPFRANRRPGLHGGGVPGEGPFGAAPHAPVWMEAAIRLVLHAFWAAAAAAGGAQIAPASVGGEGGSSAEDALPPRVDRLLDKVDALLREREGGWWATAAAEASTWPAVLLAAVAVLGAAVACTLRYGRSQRWTVADQRARALRELVEALEQEGDAAAERMARAAGVFVSVADPHEDPPATCLREGAVPRRRFAGAVVEYEEEWNNGRISLQYHDH